MKVVLILSGGLDSTTLLYQLKKGGYTVFCLSFDYGQRHRIELDCARWTTRSLEINHIFLNLQSLQASGIFGKSALTTDILVPIGYYKDESMKQTVVPNRNMIMLSIAIAYAISIGASTVFYGAHAGDHTIYPDCRPEFVEKMNTVAAICDYSPIEIRTPFLNMTKGDIVKLGISLNVDYTHTWTCYNGGVRGVLSCGNCGSCQERLEAFKQNGLKDPLDYA